MNDLWSYDIRQCTYSLPFSEGVANDSVSGR
jgi:hypothetical protein